MLFVALWPTLSGSVLVFFFFLMIRPPPSSTLFPSPPLFRSTLRVVMLANVARHFGRDPLFLRKLFKALQRCIDGLEPRLALLFVGFAVLFYPERPDKHRRSEEHTSELQSLAYLVCRLLLEKK